MMSISFFVKARSMKFIIFLLFHKFLSFTSILWSLPSLFLLDAVATDDEEGEDTEAEALAVSV
jgi:hypothetical protein